MAEKYQHSSQKGVKKTNTVRGKTNIETAEPLNHEQEHIHKWLKKVRFKKVFFGGINEVDLWKKLAELNSLYEAALSAERARYDALLAERCGSTEHGKVDGENDE